MRWRTWLAKVIALIATLSVALAPDAISAQTEDLSALDGEWIFVEDRTEGGTLQQLGPPMSSKFSMLVEEGAVVLNGHGSGHRDVRIAIDGTITEVKEPRTIARYHGSWKDGTFDYEFAFERLESSAPESIKLIRRTFRMTADGLLVSVVVVPSVVSDTRLGSTAMRRTSRCPEPAKAEIRDMAWLAGAWVGTRSTGAPNEERWSPPLGGAMFAVSRSVNTSGRMFAFEYLHIVERDGGLVYIAQPGGKTLTEFVLTELDAKRAVFDSPRHDYPKRIVYELSAEGGLIATVGQLKSGTPRRFEFKREGNK